MQLFDAPWRCLVGTMPPYAYISRLLYLVCELDVEVWSQESCFVAETGETSRRNSKLSAKVTALGSNKGDQLMTRGLYRVPGPSLYSSTAFTNRLLAIRSILSLRSLVLVVVVDLVVPARVLLASRLQYHVPS
jgi:hypothetical protein